MAKYTKETGSSTAAQLQFEKQMYNIGALVVGFEGQLERMFEHDNYIKKLLVKPAGYEREDYLLVVTAYIDGADVVAFQQGSDLSEVLTGLIKRLKNGSVKWKADGYANE